MLTVYIADDEEVVRQGLKKIIDWNSAGFGICGEAADGLTAYNEIKALNPDLIMLDIRMPKLQGLDLANQLREDGYDGRIIILSGYSEFKYAQQAIKCDVDAYLTKPIDEDELEKVVTEIKQILQKEKLHTEHVNYYQEKAKHKIIEDIITVDSMSLASINYSLTELNLDANLFQVVILQPTESGVDAFEDLCDSLRVPLNTNTVETLKVASYQVILLKGEFIIGRFYAFKERYSDSKNKPYFIAAGSTVSGINDIYYSYHEALTIYERRFFFNVQGFIASKENLPDSEELHVVFTAEGSRETAKELYEYIQLHKLNKAFELLDRLHRQLEYSSNSAESVKSHLAGMFLFIVAEFKKDYVTSDIKFQTNAEIIQKVNATNQLEEAIDYIRKNVETMIRATSGYGSEDVIDEILEYIKHHYQDDIKLKTLAPKFGYNSSYLGKIFNKKMGISFNDCLHGIRIDKAKELLLIERYKVYEVSTVVGYKNVDYFHLKFKQFENCTPNEYRIMHHIEVD